MLKRVVALTAALALGVVMAGCQPAEEGDGGGAGLEQREPGTDMGEPMASPTPMGGGGGGGYGKATPSPGLGGNEQGTPPGPDEAMPGNVDR